MGFLLTKLDLEKENFVSRFRLVNLDDGLDVVITYQSFRSVLENEGFGSHRIGYIVKLINKLYPLDVQKFRVPLEEKYNDSQLIEFLQFYGFSVRKLDVGLDILTVLKLVKERGYEVRGFVDLEKKKEVEFCFKSD
jgi:hypothetical protein